jgi:hypothetical protein
MQTKAFDPAGKDGVYLCTVENIQAPVEVVLIFAKVNVNRFKNEAYGDVPVKGGHKEPGTEVISWDVICYAFPYFFRCALRGGFRVEVNLFGISNSVLGLPV